MKCDNKVVAGRCHKEYKLDNREKLLEEKRLYYIENKEKETERFKEYRISNSFKIDCPCESSIVKHHFSTHVKSQMHKTYYKIILTHFRLHLTPRKLGVKGVLLCTSYLKI